LKRNCNIISGNHERIFLEYLNKEDSKIDKKYGSCFKKYKNEFDSELTEYIKSLPEYLNLEIDNIKFGLYHGSNFDSDFYVYPTEDRGVLDEFSKSDSDVIFIGHSHYPFMFNSGGKTIINVGSVGQSRVVGGIASWGVFDTSNSVYIPKTTLYDVSKVIEKIEELEKGKYLELILKRNNIHFEA
ncbi:MAG: metallophosphoesterase family protein, partial [Flavobacteriaceae bacterium]|nr:metallophosphoesterase family protein [Flavobacteriaceae bacterium]